MIWGCFGMFGSYFVREGWLRMWKDSKQKFKKRYCFLFNDVMLLCKKEGPLTSKKYWLRIHITLRSPHCNITDRDNSYNNDFMLNCRSRSFRFQFDSQNLKNSWMEDMQKSISGEHEEAQKEVEKSRDALLHGDITLSNKPNPQHTSTNTGNQYSYESDTSSEPEEKRQKKKKTSTSSQTNTSSSKNENNPPKKAKKENTDNESFLLIDIPSTSTTYSNNPFDNFGNQYNAPQNNSNPFVQNQPNNQPQSMGSSNPFVSNTTPSNNNMQSSSNNPFLSGSSQPQNNQGSYNPFMVPSSNTQPQQQRSESYNPFLSY
eukprot:TRINITY_DN2385_c0_g1_i2.p1 TRINITY_DN2385_c0_g1~~TRINITY_DN2385_c0_g1_i2.p1  ORF type:complete len:316 (+),score=68.49 TRINITY_DN2385_c0_g1_i2:119-1066(+)